MRYFVLIILLAWVFPAKSQNVTKNTIDRNLSDAKSATDSIYILQIDSAATAVVFAINPYESFEGSYIVIKNDTIFLSEDDEKEGNNELKFCNLISINQTVDFIRFYPTRIQHEITYFIIHAGLKESTKKSQTIKKKSTGCSVPDMIEQSEWRTGLPDPDYDRINQQVTHVIIHHTAGSNADTNFTQVVRDIYVYHTQVRMWSDIGYNYLIAPNGDIYKGRDPAIYEQDNVMGAHFCNANSGTMGISMMGTFTDIVPSDTAFQSLIALITWKLGKEHLNPFGFYYQILNPDLPAIAGHRDGCSTECPGNALYELMDSIRNEVQKNFDQCGYFITSIQAPTEHSELKIIHQGEKIVLIFDGPEPENIAVYDVLGRKIPIQAEYNGTGEAVLTPAFPLNGLYILNCQTNKGFYSGKIMMP